jgi:hypothetical protein
VKTKKRLAWNLEAIDIEANTKLGCVDELWSCWVRWVLYWSRLVRNSVVFVGNLSSPDSRHKTIWPIAMCICGYRNGVLAFMLGYFCLEIAKIHWVSFSLLSAIEIGNNMCSCNIFVPQSTINLFSLVVDAWFGDQTCPIN